MRNPNAVITKIVVAMLLVTAISFGVYKGRPELFQSYLERKVDSLKNPSFYQEIVDTTKYELPETYILLKNDLSEYSISRNTQWHMTGDDGKPLYIVLTYDFKWSAEYKDAVVFNDSMRAVKFAVSADTFFARQRRYELEKKRQQYIEDSINNRRYNFKPIK